MGYYDAHSIIFYKSKLIMVIVIATYNTMQIIYKAKKILPQKIQK